MSTRSQTQTKAAPMPSFTPTQSGLLQRKCACGGAAGISGECEKCSKKKRFGLQTKLKINEPGDIYEQEADRVADQVMAAPAHHAVSGATPRIQRFSGQSSGRADAPPASVDQALASPGRPLEPALRQNMEQRFGHNFSRVRVHSDPTAEQSAQDMNAHAYTVGHDMVFGAGRFAPGTHQGQRLIAHELTHVVQGAGHAGAPVVRRQPRPDVFPTTFKIISRIWRVAGRDIVIIETDTGIRRAFYRRTGAGPKGEGKAPPAGVWVPFKGLLPQAKAPTKPWFSKNQYYTTVDPEDPLRGYGNTLNKELGGQLDAQNIPPATEKPWQQVRKEMDDVLSRPSLAPASPPAVTASGEIGGGGGGKPFPGQSQLPKGSVFEKSTLPKGSVFETRQPSPFSPQTTLPKGSIFETDPIPIKTPPGAEYSTKTEPKVATKTTPDVTPTVKPKTPNAPAVYSPRVQGDVSMPDMSGGSGAKRGVGRGWAVLAGMAIQWGVSHLKGAVSRNPDKDWNPEAQVQRWLEAHAGELLTMQVKNPFVQVWANLTYVSMSTDKWVVAGGGDVVDDSVYHGSSLESIDFLPYPDARHWIIDEGSSRAGGGDRYVYRRKPVKLALAPFENLIAHAKANKLPLDMLRIYCQKQLARAYEYANNPNTGGTNPWNQVIHVIDHWDEMQRLLDTP